MPVVVPESAVQDWEARTGVGSAREVRHRQTVTGLLRADSPWITRDENEGQV